jgi:hypothetical protein
MLIYASNDSTGPCICVLVVIAAVLVPVCVWKFRKWDKANQIYVNNTWHKIELGFTEEQVYSLIGKPTEIKANIAANGQLGSEWRYGSLFCIGKVQFLEGKVIGFKLP